MDVWIQFWIATLREEQGLSFVEPGSAERSLDLQSIASLPTVRGLWITLVGLQPQNPQDASMDHKIAFKYLLPPGYGDTVIVKTVFEDSVGDAKLVLKIGTTNFSTLSNYHVDNDQHAKTMTP